MSTFASAQVKQRKKGKFAAPSAESRRTIGVRPVGTDVMPNSLLNAVIANEPNDVAPQSSTVGNSVGGSMEQRGLSLSSQDKRGGDWYIKMEPASPIITAGTEVMFRLEQFWRGKSKVQSMYGNYPEFTLLDENGAEIICSTRIDNIAHRQDFFAKYVTLSKPGHYRATFRGQSIRAEGSLDRPDALITKEGEFLVSLDFDVLGDLSPKTLAGLSVQTTVARDMEHLEDPEASDGEVAAAFERLAVRRGFEALEANLMEVEEQLALYTKGAGGRTGSQATEELSRIMDIDIALEREFGALQNDVHQDLQLPGGVDLDGQLPGPRAIRERAKKSGHTLYSTADIIEFVRDETERIEMARALLVEAFPVLAVVNRSPVREKFKSNQESAQDVIKNELRKVVGSIETTKRNLASGDLSILRVDPILNDTRRALAIDGDERKKTAVDRLLEEHRSQEIKTGLAVGGLTLLLLFIPGIGPYLAAVAGAGMAARSWVRFGEMNAASGAGIREGIVTKEEASAAAFWALFDTLFAVLDFGSALGRALRAAKTVAPHVPEAASRLAERTAGTTGKVVQSSEKAAEILPELASANGKGEQLFSVTEKPFSMTADELTDLAATLFRRPVKPMSGEVHFYKTMEEYAAEFKRYWPDLPVPAGYRNPNTGHIHISPRAGLMTAIHEAVHKVARETFPMGRQVLGDFLDEGITEAITRVSLGSRAASHPYDVHVKFVELLQEKLGETGASVVKNGVLQPGGYRSLRDSVKRLFGGSEQKTFVFFNRVRSIGSDTRGAIGSQRALNEAIAMLEGTGGKKLAPTVPAIEFPPVIPPKRGLPEIEPGVAPGPFGARPPGSRSRYQSAEITEVTPAAQEISDDIKHLAETTTEQVGKIPLSQFTETSGSKMLGKAMAANGRPQPAVGYHAHHIIPEKQFGDGMEWARTRLEASGSVVNEAPNGAWLAGSKSTANLDLTVLHNSYIHAGKQVEYAYTLTKRLADKTGKAFLDELEKIGIEMESGLFKTEVIPYGWKTKWKPGMNVPADGGPIPGWIDE